MRTDLPDVFAAGDCVVTHHRLLGETYLPLGTTAHKQGRVAGENALGGNREFAGSLGTQVVKIFDHAVARTGLRDHEARPVGFDPVTVGSEADDHKAYYPGSHRIAMRFTGDRTGRLLGVQLFGHETPRWPSASTSPPPPSSTSMTVDALSDLDLSYTPPLGTPGTPSRSARRPGLAQSRPDNHRRQEGNDAIPAQLPPPHLRTRRGPDRSRDP